MFFIYELFNRIWNEEVLVQYVYFVVINLQVWWMPPLKMWSVSNIALFTLCALVLLPLASACCSPAQWWQQGNYWAKPHFQRDTDWMVPGRLCSKQDEGAAVIKDWSLRKGKKLHRVVRHQIFSRWICTLLRHELNTHHIVTASCLIDVRVQLSNRYCLNNVYMGTRNYEEHNDDDKHRSIKVESWYFTWLFKSA